MSHQESCTAGSLQKALMGQKVPELRDLVISLSEKNLSYFAQVPGVRMGNSARPRGGLSWITFL
jgi:hypothetical protein